jgi:3-isopropylmalate dehydrogenase
MVLPGDGIGPEVAAEGVKALQAAAARFRIDVAFEEDIVGGAAIDKFGTALRPETLERARASSAVLFGAVGGPKWDDPSASVRPEDAILGLRKALGLFANIRPVRVYSFLADSGSLKREIVEDVDLVVLRELTGGIYFGKPKRRWTSASGRQAVDTLRYSEREVARLAKVGFELAQARRGKVTSVDKANVMESGRLWREVVNEVAQEYPDVTLQHMLVDACAMHVIRRPADFDVIITENLFGDILTDEASVLAGSMGLLPSASLGRVRRDGTGLGMYEPIHGSAPDIAGQGKANPIAMILSVAMMLQLSLGNREAAEAVEEAVTSVLQQGYRTPDIAHEGDRAVDTKTMGDLIAQAIASPGGA